MGNHTGRSGFTLIEILVALAIIAVALTAVVAETGQHISSAIQMRDRTLAHWVALNRITEQHVSESWPAIGASNGTARMGEREWYWTMRISATPDETIRRIDVEVRAERDRDRFDASAIAYLERPMK